MKPDKRVYYLTAIFVSNFISAEELSCCTLSEPLQVNFILWRRG